MTDNMRLIKFHLKKGLELKFPAWFAVPSSIVELVLHAQPHTLPPASALTSRSFKAFRARALSFNVFILLLVVFYINDYLYTYLEYSTSYLKDDTAWSNMVNRSVFSQSI